MNIRSAACDSVQDKAYHSEPENGIYLLMLTKSPIRLKLETIEKTYSAGTLIIWDGSISTDYSPEDEALVCDWISFDAENDRDFISSLDLPLNRAVVYPDSELMSQLIRSIVSELYSLDNKRMNLKDSLFRTLLIKAEEAGNQRGRIHQQTADPHFSGLTELREKIYRNPQLKWNVDSMAAYVNMSRSYFQHIYRELFGVSCMTDVISGKIEKAKEILSETSCTVSQVAAMCGYENEEHFMRQFKKIVGVTPSKYRKN